MNKSEFRNLFLKLTEYTIPFGHEEKLEKYLPPGFKKDSVGNYYYEIGQSETLFTTHLDTYSDKCEKVNHIVDSNDEYLIGTDGTTILGGDNKLGCCILIGMIKDNIPGVYYFFIGEEPILSGGLFGSSEALKNDKEYFKKFKRCIAFDRREYGSVVVRQKARMCCSKEFAKEIAHNLTRLGNIKFDENSSFGYYTDTATFMDVIEECTNISAGGFNEHYNSEYVDLNYTYKVYESAKKIDYENLPTIRQLEKRFDSNEETKVNQFNEFSQKKNLKEIYEMFSVIGLRNTRNINNNGVRHLTFSKWLEDVDFDIHLNGSGIEVNNRKVTIDALKNIVLLTFKDDILSDVKYYSDVLSKKESKQARKSLNKILSTFGCKSTSQLNRLLKK